ncbi:unnamed protein product, partial [marine sediment metagenome]
LRPPSYARNDMDAKELKQLGERMHSLVPSGVYCYDENGVCPFWGKNEAYPKQANGFCLLLGQSDWDEATCPTYRCVYRKNGNPKDIPDISLGLLWDQVKQCGINED